MSNKAHPTAKSDPREKQLVGIKTVLQMVFPDEETRPGTRTFLDWRSKRYFPYHKIGGRVFYDPEQVRRALDKRFEIKAI